MRREYCSSVVVGLAVVALVAAVGNRLYGQEQETEKGVRRVVIFKDGASKDDASNDDEQLDRIRTELELRSEFWIGAMCSEANEALRSQLSLKDGNGLVVLDVVPDSPAAKAGLKKHDVIVSVGDKPVGKVSELVKAVDAATKDAPDAEKAEVKLGIHRAGKSETISVKPEKRKDAGNKFFLRERGPLDVRVLRPGMVLSKGAKFNIKIEPFHADLPEDMTVTITKHGKESAKIVVKQGDKTWETTADKMGDLPEEVRKHVEPMTMALPFPKGDRDVITFVPNTEEIRERARDAAETVKREAEQIRIRASEAGTRAREEFKRLQKQSEELRESAQNATEEKAKELRAAADKLRRAAGEAMKEAGQAYRERDFAVKKLDDAQKEIKSEEALKTVQDLIERRFNELQKEIDALRKSVEQLKLDSKKEKE